MSWEKTFFSDGTQLRTMKKQVSIVWVIVAGSMLLAIAAALIGYAYWQHAEMRRFKERVSLEAERERLEEEYADISQEYNFYEQRNVHFNNDSLSEQLAREKLRVQRLLEELRTNKDFSSSTLDSLQFQLKTLRQSIRFYHSQIDSLSRENQQLQAERNDALDRYRKAAQTADRLQKDNENLHEKVNQAARLEAIDLQIETLNKRGKNTLSCDKVERIKIQFVIARNTLVPHGEKEIYLCIVKPDGQTLVKDRTNIFTHNDQKYYSLRQIMDYTGIAEKMYFSWNVEEYLPVGIYSVEIYADNQLIGSGIFSLKK